MKFVLNESERNQGVSRREEGITGTNTQPAPNRTGKHDLTFGGNSGLHGKTILPRVPSRRNFPWALIASSYLS